MEILYTEEFSHTFTMFAIRMKFKSNSARTLITSEGVYTVLFTAMGL
jgi:hypothetical protein